MKPRRLRWPATATQSLLAGLTTWVALWAWAGFVESPSGFLIPTLGACLIVAVSGMLLRSARVPNLLTALGQVALLFVWLNRTWAGDLMYGGWVPTSESFARVVARIEAGVQAAQAYAAPVPENAPAIYALLIIAGAGNAVLVDLIACGIRWVPLAGLPLLAIYTAPLGIPSGGVSWWSFTACALSFLFLLAGDQVRLLSTWGRHLSGRRNTLRSRVVDPRMRDSQMFDSGVSNVNTAAVHASARKIGFTATGLAVLVPILIPTMGTNLFGGSGSGSTGDGDTVAISNPIVDLKRDLSRGDDVDLMSVRTSDPDPSYLRVSVLDFFDGQTWKPSGRDIPVAQRAEGRMPRPPGLEPSVPRTEVPYSIQALSTFESAWLPTPYPISTIEVEGDWRYDTDTLDIISAAEDESTQGLGYSLDALQIKPDPRDMASAPPVAEELFTAYTALPDSVPDAVRTLAREVTDAQTSRFEKAVRLQEWFRGDGGFTYSLERSSGNGVDELAEFLGTGPDSRIGYCEQFAAAMSLMGRSIGIPSRVAVGFLRPERVSETTYTYSSHDLHAWPEMYFEGTGWVRFEPTPRSRAESVPGYTSRNLGTNTPDDQASSAAPDARQNRIDEQNIPTPTDPAGGGDGGGSGGLLVGFFAGLLLLFALAASPWLARATVRRRRWANAQTPVEVAEVAWAELRDGALDLGVPWDDSVTIRARARSLVHSFGEPDANADDRLPRSGVTGPRANPEATAALDRLAKFVERARYARAVEAPQRDVAHDVGLCVRALRDGTTTSRRWRATLLPASVTRKLRREMSPSKPAPMHRSTMAEPGVDHAI
ncbi:MAG TPA: DUF3488 and transglutaminase-like domain-containing protein [Nocardioidaceae bacterium]|nr:DUF3488 and transglutaminase-like domain-containing protein [Nocardioidaceae bacterium]